MLNHLSSPSAFILIFLFFLTFPFVLFFLHSWDLRAIKVPGSFLESKLHDTWKTETCVCCPTAAEPRTCPLSLLRSWDPWRWYTNTSGTFTSSPHLHTVLETECGPILLSALTRYAIKLGQTSPGFSSGGNLAAIHGHCRLYHSKILFLLLLHNVPWNALKHDSLCLKCHFYGLSRSHCRVGSLRGHPRMPP